MIELMRHQFDTVGLFVDNYESAYPYSVIEKRQFGRIFVDDTYYPSAILYWHNCGFVQLSGCPDTDFLQGLLGLMRHAKSSFTLLMDKEPLEAFFMGQADLQFYQREHFELPGVRGKDVPCPKTAQIELLDESLLSKLVGRITPSFSWASQDDFLRNGKGFCVLENDTVAACAFSAAIGGGFVDIGIETHPEYRGRGFGTMASGAMVNWVVATGAKPAWGCAEHNTGSRKLAERIGFRQTCSYPVFSVTQ